MANNGEVVIKINGDDTDFKQKINGVGTSLKTLKSTISALGIGTMIQQIIKAITECVNEYAKVERLNNRMIATWKNVGKATGYTAKQMLEYADAIEKTTYFEAESVQAGAQLLASIQKLSEDGFQRALDISIDLAEAMGTDVPNACQTLANALQNPETGLRALRTVGVTFTDTEKEMMNSLIDSGREFEAHDIILSKVESKYKGIAKAVAETPTNTLTQIGNTLGTIKEDLGEGILNAVSPALKEIYSELLDIEKWSHRVVANNKITNSLKDKTSLSEFETSDLENYATDLREDLARLQSGGKTTKSNWLTKVETELEARRMRELRSASAKAMNYQTGTAPENNNFEIMGNGSDEKLKKLNDFLTENAELSRTAKAEAIQAQIEEANAYIASGLATEEQKTKLGEITQALEEQKEALYESESNWQEYFTTIASYLQEALSAFSDYYSQIYENEAERLESSLEARKEAGDLTVEEELKMQDEINEQKKKAFEAEKKNSIMQALINGALAITQAFAQLGPIAGAVASALVATTTAVQVATINQQQYQGYEEGGIVGGTGITGDRHQIWANAGELILTKAQQRSIASQLNAKTSSPTVNVEFSGNIFGDDTTIAQYVYDAIKTAQYNGEVAKW